MIHYNQLKHHRTAIQELIARVLHDHSQYWPKIKDKLVQIGNRTLDLYIGDLSVNDVKTEILEKLTKEGISSEQTYYEHMHKQKIGYLEMTLSDSSKWVLRIGRYPFNIVHIHPGRYSPHTIRTHGNALKTAILIICSDKVHSKDDFSVAHVNQLRSKLELSPVKSLESLLKIKKLIALLSTSASTRI